MAFGAQVAVTATSMVGGPTVTIIRHCNSAVSKRAMTNGGINSGSTPQFRGQIVKKWIFQPNRLRCAPGHLCNLRNQALSTPPAERNVDSFKINYN